MADDKKTESDDKPDPVIDPDAGAKAALQAERKARRDAESKLADVQKRLDDIEAKDKTDVQRLSDEVAQLKKDRDDHAAKALRLEVAAAKGLSPAQAKRLVGTSKDDLEADADEILEAFGGGTKTDKGDEGDKPKGPPSQRPKPNLSGGGDPTVEPVETDPAKLAASVPRQ